MVSFWIYLTLGVILASMVLGVLAINTAMNQNTGWKLTDGTGTPTLEEEKEMLRQRTHSAIIFALNHPEVQKYSSSAYNTNWDFSTEYIDGEEVDVTTIHTYGKQTVEGHWSTGYTSSYTNNTDIVFRIDPATKELLDINVIKTPDRMDNTTYNAEIQKVIRFAMQDDLARKFLESDEYYVRFVRYSEHGLGPCSVDPCGIILVDKINSKITSVISVNLNEDYPIRVCVRCYASAPFQLRIDNDDPEPIPSFHVKRGQSFDVPLVLVPIETNNTVVVKLEASLVPLQDYYARFYKEVVNISETFVAFSFSAPEIEIQKDPVEFNLSVSISNNVQKGAYLLAVDGKYEGTSNGAIAFINIEE